MLWIDLKSGTWALFRETQDGPHPKMIERVQYAVAWVFVKMLGVLPRPVARGLAAGPYFVR